MAFTSFVIAMALSAPVEGFRSSGNAPFVTLFGPDENRPSRTKPGEDWAAVFKARNRLKKPQYDLEVNNSKPVGFLMAEPSECSQQIDAFGESIVQHEGKHPFTAPKVAPRQSTKESKTNFIIFK